MGYISKTCVDGTTSLTGPSIMAFSRKSYTLGACSRIKSVFDISLPNRGGIVCDREVCMARRAARSGKREPRSSAPPWSSVPYSAWLSKSWNPVLIAPKCPANARDNSVCAENPQRSHEILPRPLR